MRLFCYLLLTLSMQFLIVSSCSGHIHFLCVVDSNAPNIGEDASASGDLVRTSLFSSIAKGTLTEKRLEGRQVTIDGLQRAITSLKVAPSDTVVFYYCGHGNYSNVTGSSLRFFAESKNLQFSTVKRWLQAKRPRFLLTLNDSCSVKRRGRVLFPAPYPFQPDESSEIADRLFIQNTGWFHINSSSASEFALSRSGALDAEASDNGFTVVPGTPFAWSFYERITGNQHVDFTWERFTRNVRDDVAKRFRDTYPQGYRVLGRKPQFRQSVWGQRDGKSEIR